MIATTEEVAARPAAEPGPLPAAFRWALALPGFPLRLGLVAALASLALGLAVTGVGNRLFLVGHAIYALYWVWAPLALDAFIRGTARDLVELGPALGAGTAGAESLRDEVCRAGARATPIGLGVGLAVALFDLWLIFGELGELLDHRGSVGIYLVVRELAVNFVVFSVLGWATGAARGLSRIAGRDARVDLLDPRGLAPLGRCGSRLAFWWLVMIGVSLIFLFDPDLSRDLVVQILLYTLGFAALTAVAVAIPSWGAHRALATAKQAELTRVRAQLREARESREDARLPGLLAWEQRIEALSEWPIDARSLRLTGLYVLIPFASWIAGALVERVVDSLLG